MCKYIFKWHKNGFNKDRNTENSCNSEYTAWISTACNFVNGILHWC